VKTAKDKGSGVKKTWERKVIWNLPSLGSKSRATKKNSTSPPRQAEKAKEMRTARGEKNKKCKKERSRKPILKRIKIKAKNSARKREKGRFDCVPDKREPKKT